MDSKTKAAADAAYEKYKQHKAKGTLPTMSPKVKAAAERAYAKLHGKGIVERKAIEKKALKKAVAKKEEKTKKLETNFKSLGANAPAAAKAYQTFKEGKHAKRKLSATEKKAMGAAWKKYQAKHGSE